MDSNQFDSYRKEVHVNKVNKCTYSYTYTCMEVTGWLALWMLAIILLYYAPYPSLLVLDLLLALAAEYDFLKKSAH